MAWISKKELKKKLTELGEKVSELGREKFPEELPENIKEQIRGIVRSETKKLSDDLSQTQKDLKTTDTQLIELTTKVKKFIFSTRKITKTVFQEIENKLKEALGKDFFDEKPEEPTEPDETAVGVQVEQQEVAEDDQAT